MCTRARRERHARNRCGDPQGLNARRRSGAAMLRTSCFVTRPAAAVAGSRAMAALQHTDNAGLSRRCDTLYECRAGAHFRSSALQGLWRYASEGLKRNVARGVAALASPRYATASFGIEPRSCSCSIHLLRLHEWEPHRYRLGRSTISPARRAIRTAAAISVRVYRATSRESTSPDCRDRVSRRRRGEAGRLLKGVKSWGVASYPRSRRTGAQHA